MSAGRIYFFNRYVYPDHSATSQLLTDVAFHLAEAGRAVSLVGSRQRYDDAEADLSRGETVLGVELLRVGGTRFGRSSLIGRALDYLSYLLGSAGVLLRSVRRGDTVVLMTDPPLLGAVLGPLARWRGASCVHWVQDLFPEVAEVLLGRFWSSWRVAPLRWLRDTSLRRAHHVIAISTGMRRRMADFGVASARISIIENWTDDESILPLAVESNALREEWGLGGKFVVGYSGNLGRAHDWRTLLDVATTLRERDDIVFLLIGGGAGQRTFMTAAAERKLRNVQLRPYQPREQLAMSLCVPDLHWLSLHPGLEGTIFPSKLYGIFAAGRPCLFVGDPQGEVAKLVQEVNCGVGVQPGAVDELTVALLRYVESPERVALDGKRARAWLDEHAPRANALRKLQACLAFEDAARA